MAIKFKRISDLRVDHDLLQKDIAKILGANRNTYPHWESGLYEFPLDMIDKLANYYNVSIDYLTGLSDFKGDKFRNYDNKILPKRLYKVRKQKKLSQEKLGLMMNGVSQMKLSRYENGVTLIPFSTLYLLAETLEVSIDYLMGRTDDMKIQKNLLLKK